MGWWTCISSFCSRSPSTPPPLNEEGVTLLAQICFPFHYFSPPSLPATTSPLQCVPPSYSIRNSIHSFARLAKNASLVSPPLLPTRFPPPRPPTPPPTEAKNIRPPAVIRSAPPKPKTPTSNPRSFRPIFISQSPSPPNRGGGILQIPLSLIFHLPSLPFSTPAIPREIFLPPPA